VSEQKIRVRKAEPRDVVNIIKVLQKGWDEQTVEYAPVDDLRAYRWILSIIEEGFLAVADLNGRIVGTACVSPYRPPWSQQWFGDVEFLYVLPAFRDAGVMDELLKAIETYADKFEANLTFGISSGDRVKVKDRMMQIAGWTYTGGNFIRPHNGQKQENIDNQEGDD
jgi:GNAT superfamily N-acetyltransferase